MQYFTADFVNFFKDLGSNNHKEWFHTHKKRYETSVKQPFEVFLQALIYEIQKLDTTVQVQPKDCILRINRDIRFSKDKSPYNLHYTAFVSKAGRKDKSIPGIFLRFSPKMIGVMGGCFGPSKEQLHAIRTALSKDTGSFRNILEDPTLVQHFGTLRGDAIKRIPKEWKEAHQKEPLIANKQFYMVTELSADLITSTELLYTIVHHWKVLQPLNTYLLKAIQ